MTKELEQVFEVLRWHTTRLVQPADGTARVPALEVLVRRCRRLVRVGSSVSGRADGFPSSVPGNGAPGGGKGGGRRLAVRDGEGGVDLVPVSSVELAVLSPAERDGVSLQAGEALRALRAAVVALDELGRVLDRFDRFQSTAQVPDPPMCWVAQVRHGLPWDLEWEPWRATDFAGQLPVPFDEPRKVCRFVYWFVRNHGRLPERSEMLAQLERSSVKVRVK